MTSLTLNVKKKKKWHVSSSLHCECWHVAISSFTLYIDMSWTDDECYTVFWHGVVFGVTLYWHKVVYVILYMDIRGVCKTLHIDVMCVLTLHTNVYVTLYINTRWCLAWHCIWSGVQCNTVHWPRVMFSVTLHIDMNYLWDTVYWQSDVQHDTAYWHELSVWHCILTQNNVQCDTAYWHEVSV